MDENPYQMLGDVGEALPMRPGNELKTDTEYKRNGTCSIFAFVEPPGENTIRVSTSTGLQLTGHMKSNIYLMPCIRMPKK
ncbi:hypothetical protein AALA98_06180 [Lachnospiraceae bacterium 45-W7]